MKIDNLKDFKALIKVCRELGIESVETAEISFKMGVLPHKPSKEIRDPAIPDAAIKVPAYNGPIAEPEVPETEELTEEQLLHWSSQSREEVHQ